MFHRPFHRLVLAGFLPLALGATVTEANAQCGGVPQQSGPAPESPTPANPAPSTPSTPSPSTPGTPSPNTPSPNTPGPKGSAPPTTPRGGVGGGIPIVFTRQSTSREILSIDWDYPTRVAEKREQQKGTAASTALRALPKVAAFVKIAGDDNRPLLVLRECPNCKGTDFAFLNRKLNNEKTMLLAQWFHCIKLPPSVVHPTHHFRNLFPGKPPHLFIAKVDGSDLQSFDGKQTQSSMQKAMIKMIKECYDKDPKPALKSMLVFLSKFDDCDIMEQTLLQQIKSELYSKGPKSSKLKKLNAKLDEVKARKAKAMKNAKAVCDLKLKVVGAPAPKKVGTGGGSK